ncbi:hypothetical protein UT300018_15450 [Clostridium faecium]
MIGLDNRELVMLQSLPLDIKIAKSKQRIREAIEHFGVDGVYVPVSGGKDSMVVSRLVEQVQIELGIPKEAIPRVNSNTGNEYTEVLEKARELSDIEVRPTKSIYKVFTEEGYPVGSKKVSRMLRDLQNPTEDNKATRTLYDTGIKRDGTRSKSFKLPNKWRKFIDSAVRCSEKCCFYLKKEPMYKYEKETGRHPIMGVMASEGGTRKSGYLETGCNAFESQHPQSKPIGFWLESDILAYIILNDLEIASVYGEIVETKNQKTPSKLKIRLMIKYGRKLELTTTLEKRTGCVCCTYGVTLEKGENRFQRLKRLDPKRYNFCIYGGEIKDGRLVPKMGLGLGYVLDMMDIPYDNDKGQIKGQISMFDSEKNERVFIGDKYINDYNKTVATVIEIDRNSILMSQTRGNEKSHNIKLNLEWLLQLINDGTIRKLS